MLTVTTAAVPYVAPKDRSLWSHAATAFTTFARKYGFMQDPHVPEALGVARDHGVELDPEDMIYFLGRETIIVTQRPGMALWRAAIRVDGAQRGRATAFFRLPPGASSSSASSRNVGMPSTCGGRL